MVQCVRTHNTWSGVSSGWHLHGRLVCGSAYIVCGTTLYYIVVHTVHSEFIRLWTDLLVAVRSKVHLIDWRMRLGHRLLPTVDNLPRQMQNVQHCSICKFANPKGWAFISPRISGCSSLPSNVASQLPNVLDYPRNAEL